MSFRVCEKDNKKTCVAIFSNHGQTAMWPFKMLGYFFQNPKTSVEIQSPKNPQLWISLGNNLKIIGTDQAFYVDTNCDIGEHDKMAAFKPGIPLQARLTCQSGNEIKTNQFPIGNDVPKTVMNHLFESDDCKESPLRIYQNGNWVGYSRLNEIEKDQIVEHSAIIDGKRFTCSFKQSDIKIQKPAQFFKAGLIDYLGQSTSRRLTGPSQQLGNGINPKDNSFYRYLSELSLNVSAIPTATMYVNNTKVPMHVGAVVKQLDNQTNATDVWVMVSNLFSTNHKTDELFKLDFFLFPN